MSEDRYVFDNADEEETRRKVPAGRPQGRHRLTAIMSRDMIRDPYDRLGVSHRCCAPR